MTKINKYKTNILFSRPTIIDGVASIFNISGNYFEFNYSESAEEADSKAIESDWGVIGNDIIEAKKQLHIINSNGWRYEKLRFCYTNFR